MTTTVHLEMPKLRDGVPPRREEVVISSIKQDNGVLLNATVVSNGPVESRKAASSSDALLEEVVAYLKTVTSARQGAIAEAVGEDPKSGTLRKALKAGLESGALNQDGRGKPYRFANHDEGPAI